MKKNEKGITLIALVITIIVMLILVAVVVNIAFKNGGIFTTTNNAAKSTTIAAEQEDLHNWCFGTYFDATSGTLDLAKLSADSGFITTWGRRELNSGKTELVVTNTKSKNKYTIKSNGEIIEGEEKPVEISEIGSVSNGKEITFSSAPKNPNANTSQIEMSCTFQGNQCKIEFEFVQEGTIYILKTFLYDANENGSRYIYTDTQINNYQVTTRTDAGETTKEVTLQPGWNKIDGLIATKIEQKDFPILSNCSISTDNILEFNSNYSTLFVTK